MTQYTVSSSVEEHQGFEALDVIEWVDGSIIEFSLRHPKLWRGKVTHYVRGERWLYIEPDIKGIRGSNFEGLQLMAHVVDLMSKVDPSQVYGRKGSMIVGGLDGKSRTGRAVRFGTLIVWMIFKYQSDRRWSWWWLMHLKRSRG